MHALIWATILEALTKLVYVRVTRPLPFTILSEIRCVRHTHTLQLKKQQKTKTTTTKNNYCNPLRGISILPNHSIVIVKSFLQAHVQGNPKLELLLLLNVSALTGSPGFYSVPYTHKRAKNHMPIFYFCIAWENLTVNPTSLVLEVGFYIPFPRTVLFSILTCKTK